MKIDIKNFIDVCGISKNELSRKLEISYPTMLSIYKGEATSIRLDTLEKLCLIFDCTPNDIFTLEHDINGSKLKEESKYGFIPYIRNSDIDTKNFDNILKDSILDYIIERTPDGEKIAIPIYKIKDDPEENNP